MPATAATVTAPSDGSHTSDALMHRKLVDELQLAVLHDAREIDALDVESILPNCRPDTVTDAPPE